SGLGLRAFFKCFQTGGAHPSEGCQRLDAAYVHGAPDTARLPRREADEITLAVDTLAHAVDPADAERFVHCFGPGDAGLAGALLIEDDEQLGGGFVMFVEPGPELGRGGEESRRRRLAGVVRHGTISKLQACSGPCISV